VCAWDFPFKGKAADVLLSTIMSYLDRNRSVFSRHACVINSSETGKSRMVDELAKKIVTVPMCLQEESRGSTFPSFCFSVCL